MSHASNEHIQTNTNLIIKINMFVFFPLASISHSYRISVIVLHDCLFVPDSIKNLVLVSKLCNDNYSVSFNKTFIYTMKENEVLHLSHW